jgi:hypothetical protein
METRNLDKPKVDYVENLPDPAVLRQELAELIQRRELLRGLLRLAERQAARRRQQQAEQKEASCPT